MQHLDNRLRRSPHGIGQVIIFLIGLTNFTDLHSETDPWSRFDTDPSLTAQLGSSRLTKWMLVHSNAGDQTQQINLQLFHAVIAQVLGSDQGLALLKADLARGDVDLERTLGSLFSTFNFPESEARRLLKLLATGNENETLRSTPARCRSPSELSAADRTISHG